MPRVQGRRKKKRCHNADSLYSEKELKNIPKSLIVRNGPSTTKSARLLVNDLRLLSSPWSSMKLRDNKTSKLKDYIAFGTTFDVTHLQILKQSNTQGVITLRMARLPAGPTLTFQVEKFSLMHDVRISQKKSHTKSDDFKQSPLVILNNFKNESAAIALSKPLVTNHKEIHNNINNRKRKKNDIVENNQDFTQESLKQIGVEKTSITPNRLVADFLTNMYPPIDVTKTTSKKCKRVVLYSMDNESGAIEQRHYALRMKPRGVTKGIRKILSSCIQNNGGSSNKHMIDMMKSHDIADFILSGGSGNLTDSEVEDSVEIGDNEITKKQKIDDGKKVSFSQKNDFLGVTGVVALGLIEIGPRVTLQLLKIEEDLCKGTVLFDRNDANTAASFKNL